jgi:hypothetical protein
VVPGGGLSPEHTQWISSGANFFLPVKVLSRVFRGKFVAGLRSAFRNRQLLFYGDCMALAEEKNFTAFLGSLVQQDWVVYAKPPFGGPEHVLHYLARYTHRVAISNHRLLTVTDNEVAFGWKDYAHGSKQRTMTLSQEEFLRRFLQHVLPRGFPRHPLLRMDGQPYTRRDDPPLLPPPPSAVAGNGCSVVQSACYLAMSSLPEAHVRYRAAYRSTDLLCRSPTCMYL